ncbi:MAG: hypothetical protein B6D55_06220 [Candidatus Omnitrophica bacterium 4484_70.2]|nr:MAG: hypothetical protein B6D55_06220 [Candidatus Omnitrophica bacterium 4484_70.2]
MKCKLNIHQGNYIADYGIWILLTILFLPTFIKLYTFRWSALEYGHAYFILPISIYLIFRKRKKIKELSQKSKTSPSKLGIFLFIFGIFIYNFGYRQNYMVLTTFSLIPILWGLIEMLYGKKSRQEVTFPIVYLLLMVPPPFALIDYFTLPLRYATVLCTERILRILNYSIQREGLMLIVNGKKIMISGACSGFRFLFTLLALGLLYIYFKKSPLRDKLILSLFILPLALLGNIIRVTIISLLNVHFGKEIAEGFLHTFSGIVIFIFLIWGLIAFDYIFKKIGWFKEYE